MDGHKISLLVLSLVLVSNESSAQYFDWSTDLYQLKAELVNQAALTAADKNTIKRLETIREYKEKALENLTIVQTVQARVYFALTQINSALKNGKMIKDCYSILEDIVKYQKQVTEYAKDDPVLLLFAEKSEADFKRKSVDLMFYISDFVAKHDKDVLMDTGKRDELISHIQRELRILRALSYSAKNQMFYASFGSKLEKLNPWQSYVNQDKRLIQEILRNTKFE
jgi:hypothetical protein